ncbi:MAG: hypothetical protein QXS16_05055 [Pyrobaculum sp.]
MFPYHVATDYESKSYYIIDTEYHIHDTVRILYQKKGYDIREEVGGVMYRGFDEFVKHMSHCNIVVKAFGYDVKRSGSSYDRLLLGPPGKLFSYRGKYFSLIIPQYHITHVKDKDIDRIKQYLSNGQSDNVIVYDVFPYNVLFYLNYAIFYRNDIDKFIDAYAELIKSIIKKERILAYDVVNDINKFFEIVKKLENVKNTKNQEIEKIVNFANALRSIVPTKS